MRTQPSLSSYILVAAVIALLTIGIFDNPFGLVSANQQFPRRPPQARAEAAFSKVTATTHVNRTHKSDRLQTRADPATNTMIVRKNPATPVRTVRSTIGTPAEPKIFEIDGGKRAPKAAPAPLPDCGGIASQISDPMLSHFIGRCFV
jgi:uncharacterized protein (DUF58 family)